MDWLDLFNSDGFIPRRTCGSWTNGLMLLHTVSDFLIWVAYISIPFALIYFVRKKKDIPFPRMFWMFGLFIVSCGFTHLVEVVIFYWPIYRFAGVLKAFTAAVSLATVYGLWRVIPAALAMKSPKELETQVEARTGELEKINQRYKSLIGVMTDVVWFRDTKGMFSVPQQGWERYTGQTWEQYKEDGWLNAIHPDDRSMVVEDWRQSLATLKEHSVQKRVWHAASKDWRWCDARAVPLFDNNEEVVEWVGMISDIHDRITADQKHKESEKQFRLLANSIPQLAWMGRPDGYLYWYNQRWYDYTGTTPEEMQGWGWDKVHDPVELPRILATWGAAIANGEPWEDTFPLRRHDGEMRWHLSRATPLRDEDGHIVMWFGTNTDITSQRDLEQRLKEESQSKDNFLAMLAHELRNPLAPILNCVTILRKDQEEETRSWAMDTVDRQVGHMARLVDDLLDVSRIMRGKVELKYGTTDITSVLFHAIETVKPLLESPAHKFILCLPKHDRQFQVDGVRLAQIVSNLLSNAAKYTPNQGTIWLIGDIEDDKVIISVKDTGIGIEEEHHTKIFDPFYQVDRSLDRSKGGLGIGLALVKSLVQLHQGTIEVRSEPLAGSEFIVTVPIQKEGHEMAVEAEEEKTPGSVGYKILVVDDNVDAAKSLAIMLRYEGHETQFAFSGPAAIEVCKTFHPQIILLDIGLPEMSGYEVCKVLRTMELCRGVCILAMTGYNTEEHKRQSKEAGMNDHLVKPVTWEVLKSAIKTHAKNGCH